MIETPKRGQESVWDYPRPPRVEPSSEHVRVVLGRMSRSPWNFTTAVPVGICLRELAGPRTGDLLGAIQAALRFEFGF